MGYQKIRYSTTDVHIYLQEQGEKITLLQIPYGSKSVLSKMKSKIVSRKLKSIINTSYFNGIVVIGRNQGELYNNTLDQTTKDRYDYVIKKDGSHLIGKFQSWDHQNDVVIGFSPALVLIEDGVDVEKLSTEFCGTDKITKKQPNTAFGVLKDGRSVMIVVEGRNANDTGLNGSQIRSFVKKYYPSIKHLVMLDGGGSSEMIVNGIVKNYLSDRAERPMCNGLAFYEETVIKTYAVNHGEYATEAEAVAERDRLIALGYQAIIRTL